MDVKTEALKLACPTCGAKSHEPCVRINGSAMPEPHTKRKALATALTPNRQREDVNQAAARIVRETPKD